MSKFSFTAAVVAAGLLAASAASATVIYDFSITGGAGTATSPILNLTWTAAAGATGVEDKEGTWYFTDTNPNGSPSTNGYANLRLDGGGPTGTAVDLGVNNLPGGGSDYFQFADQDATQPLFTYSRLSPDGRPLAASFPLIPGGVTVDLTTPDHLYSGVYTFTAVCGSASCAGGLTAPSVGAAVPEPAAWALMLVGFGGLGVALRSSRKTVIA